MEYGASWPTDNILHGIPDRRFLDHGSEMLLTQIEPKLNSTIISKALRLCMMRGMCHRCYSSGVPVMLDDDGFETVCDVCRTNSAKKI